jgi:DNA-binding NarL/FixJ family response regulator
VRVILVEDHPLLRLGVRELLRNAPGYEVVGEAGSARAAFQLIESARPDVVLMDIVLPGMDGVVATREILRRRPEVKVLIVSGHDEVQDVRDALAAGAVGYVLKAESADTLLQALAQVGRGERYIAPSLAEQMSMVSPDSARTADVLGVLSEREHEVFRLAADCQEPQDIARELCLARKTVDTHLNRINRKLGLRNRAALVRLATRLGLVHAVRTSRPSLATPVVVDHTEADGVDHTEVNRSDADPAHPDESVACMEWPQPAITMAKL